MDMKDAVNWNRSVGLWGARLVVGCLTFELGMHKLFIAGLASQMKWFEALAAWFPWPFLWAVNIYCGVVEFIAGLMLVVGIKRDWALWAILSVLVIVNFGHGLEHMVWDIQQLVFRLSMIVLLLLLPAEWDLFRLDRWSELKTAFRGKSGGAQ